jgi:hypothetical protein
VECAFNIRNEREAKQSSTNSLISEASILERNSVREGYLPLAGALWGLLHDCGNCSSIRSNESGKSSISRSERGHHHG